MADTTGLTAAQISALATAGATRTVIPATTANVAIAASSLRFYIGDAGSPGVHIEARNHEFMVDATLASLVPSVLTNGERNALIAVLEKLHVALVMP